MHNFEHPIEKTRSCFIAWEDDLYKNVDKTVVEVPIVTKVPKESQKLDNSVKIIHEIAVEILARYR